MISYDRPSASSASTSDRYSGSTLSSSSCTGTTTEIATPVRRLQRSVWRRADPVATNVGSPCRDSMRDATVGGIARRSCRPTSLSRMARRARRRGADVERLNDRLASSTRSTTTTSARRSRSGSSRVAGWRSSGRSWATCDGLDVAEVGSGGGHVLRMFPEARLTAIDVSDEYLAIAREEPRRVSRHGSSRARSTSSTLPPGEFDRVICTEVLEHVVDPERRARRDREAAAADRASP